MNKVIQQLAKQAWDESPNTANKYVVYTEKLAELIVRECSKVNNQYVGWRIGDIDLDIVYKKHFGVK